MYKIDMHAHTSEVSRCGNVCGADTVMLYKQLGYSGLVITDHYYKDFFNSLGNLSWADKIDVFLGGYKSALNAGKKENIDVFLGIELRFTENPNDYLIYGITEEFLKSQKNLFDLCLEKFRPIAEAEGFLIYQAHPFRPHMVTALPELIDGIEIFNGNPRHNSKNHLAHQYALENNLYQISGSDFHELEDAGRGGLMLEKGPTSYLELLSILKEGRFSLIETP